MEVFLLHCIIWSGKIYTKFGSYLLITTHIKEHARKKLLLFLTLTFAGKFIILLLRHSFTGIRTTSSRFNSIVKSPETSTLRDTTTRFVAFPMGDKNCKISWITASKTF